VTGYTNGTLDTKTHQWIIRGSDAHAWTQIYFAQYGWVNFEPSASFPNFTRPVRSTNSVPTVTPGGNGSSPIGSTTKPRQDPNLQGDSGSGLTGSGSNDVGAQVRQSVGIVLLVLFIFILGGLIYFSLWWRRLFRGYGLPSQIFGRMSVLANWAGVVPRRSQTPYEYVQTLSETVPDSAVTIERLGDIYVRDRWADPSDAHHPRRTGEVNQLSGLWKVLQPRLFIYVLRHPHFLHRVPDSIGRFMRRHGPRRKRRRDDGLTL
jgi:hypothetical protein